MAGRTPSTRRASGVLDPFRVVVVDSEHEQLTAAEQAAVEAYEGWFERFDPEQDAYVHRCPDCVKHSDVRFWIG